MTRAVQRGCGCAWSHCSSCCGSYGPATLPPPLHGQLLVPSRLPLFQRLLAIQTQTYEMMLDAPSRLTLFQRLLATRERIDEMVPCVQWDHSTC